LGQLPPRPSEFHVARSDHPGLGAILHKLLGNREDLPAWVVLPRYFGTYSPPYKGQSAGFLGGEFDPVMFDKERKGSLTEAPLKLAAIEPPEGVDAERLRSRWGGQVYGESDAQGALVKDRPVSPSDFAATVLYAFGLSPEDAVPDAAGRPVRISDGNRWPLFA
jgi:hypothetical protein